MNRKRSGRKAALWIAIVIVVAGAALGVAVLRAGAKPKGVGPVVKVERGSIVEKALAVGSIVPREEVSVKAKVSGVVKRIHREPGQEVAAGDPLLEIQPDPTPLELAEARRRVDMDRIGFDDAQRSYDRAVDLRAQGHIADKEFEAADKAFRQARLQLESSRERLQLIEQGHASIAGQAIDAVVRAPIAGAILEKNINLGDPVVPLTSYQEGTVLMTIADMDSLIFKGTVDEIDVGKLVLGMPVEIKIGALPGRAVHGRLTKISLKAREQNNTRLFPVEIALADTAATKLRAGYSANADIIIRRADGVLTIPERVIYAHGDSTWVEVPSPTGERQRTMIATGLSDAVRIEVTSGLTEGQDVLEKPEKKL